MLTLKFTAKKLEKGLFLVIPTIMIGTSELVVKSKFIICLSWINFALAVGVNWGKNVDEQ